MFAGITATTCVDDTYCVGTGLPFTSTVAKSRRLFGFCEKLVPVSVTCTGGAFNATGAVSELGEILEITGIGYRTGSWYALESTELGFCTVIGTKPARVRSLGNMVPIT